MYEVQNWTGAAWVRVCSENVRANGMAAMREMWIGAPGLYRLVHQNKVLAVMGVG